MAKYEAGQKVKFTGMAMPATIISGPHPTHGADRWLIRKADETVSLVKDKELSPVLTRRDAVAKAIYEGTTGRLWSQALRYTRDGYYRLADHAIKAYEAADADTKAAPLAVGDSIRILETRHDLADVIRGDILRVTSVSGDCFNTNAPRQARLGAQWVFQLENEGRGWERV